MPEDGARVEKTALQVKITGERETCQASPLRPCGVRGLPGVTGSFVKKFLRIISLSTP